MHENKMFSFGSKSKLFVGTVFKPQPKISNPRQVRGYVAQREDEDIKWQWSVRESPCQHCRPYARPGWFKRLLRRGKCVEELTNRHREVKYQPKLWELEYYSYLLPDCEAKANKKGSKTHKKPNAQSTYSVCPAKNYACEGKKMSVHLRDQSDNDLKPCTEKLGFELNEPFCLNEVCGKVKPPKEDNAENEEPFKCLNNMVECKDKDEDTNKKDCK